MYQQYLVWCTFQMIPTSLFLLDRSTKLYMQFSSKTCISLSIALDLHCDSKHPPFFKVQTKNLQKQSTMQTSRINGLGNKLSNGICRFTILAPLEREIHRSRSHFISLFLFPQVHGLVNPLISLLILFPMTRYPQYLDLDYLYIFYL